ncbi:type VI secretion system protein ImpL [Andreprevotia lacus DSM 23236]|jgi:type VI secretion system protein ImpL|uniref:Type VI secretion system protein ImpL n=1 Tax=Andreprevotia lacus DSM 23236 TaxID=1121001 RepID=A0A1W1Y195_9NEIS|nr:type VI secretion system membrane subunit TssM [Andreprevotia lacus]SMC29538.1 type VI secretion system protein ImpL [Andreprevotia lacus DSM 23236]
MSGIMNFFSRALGLIFSRHLWVLLGLILLACLIWLVGPLVAIGRFHPLESALVRWLLIGLIFTIWLARVLYRTWRAAQLNAQLLNQIRTPGPRANAAEAVVNPHLEELRGRFDEAAERLKTAQFRPQGGTGLARWLDRFSPQYLYQLPWYVFIGAPGSGKTTALVNAGLDFPLAEQFGKAAVRGVGGTRNCDWWFTNEAVLIDTAGRYTMQESNREQDQGEWQGFVDLLKKYRARQPINGAILTISMADLLGAGEQERTQHALTLRKRLQELRTQLGIQFPVYVLVTKVDLLAGFTEYFNQLGREERAQVWGMTFPLAAVQAGNFDFKQVFATEYAQLLARLYAGLPEQMLAELDPRQRELAYLLPQEFAGVQALLAQFLEQVFSESRFEASALLRGVYFTSGTQEGTVFDRVMGGLKRFLQVDSQQRPQQLGEPGRSFFLRSLMQDVIFKEAGIAGSNERWQRKQSWLRRAGYVAVGVGMLVLTLGWVASYHNNQRYVAEVAARLPGVAAQISNVKLGDRAQVTEVMPTLDKLRALPVSTEFNIDSPPLSYRLGLFQGDKLRAAADGAYDRALEDTLLPLLARRLEDGLRNAPQNDIEFEYSTLKAYLMLYDAAHYDAAFLEAWLSLDIERSLGRDVTRAQREVLSQHLKRLFSGRAVSSPYARDDALVAQVRERLQKHTLAERIYSGMKRALRRDDRLVEFNAADAVGPQAPLVFQRASGASLNNGVPGIFSYKGYWDVFAPRVDETVARRGLEEAWVLAPRQPEVASPEAIANWSREVKRLYFTDYIAAWEGYLADMRLRSGKDLAQNIQIARTLSAADSPLVRFMTAASRETTLVRDKDDDDRTLIDQAKDKVSDTRASLEDVFGKPDSADKAGSGKPGDKQELLVDQRFAGLRQFTRPGEKGAPAPIAGVRDTLNELYTFLTATDAALRGGNAPPSDEVLSKIRAEAGRLPEPFRNMLGDLANASNGNVAHVVQQQLGQDASANIGDFCHQAADGRYPLARGSARDMAPGDFAQLFAPAGMMDDFFQKHLATQVDTAARPWRFKGENGARANFLAAFERAAVIRDVYFSGGSRTPSVRVEIKPVQMDANISQIVLDIDGQIVRYAHGPQVGTQVQWPGTRGSNQIRVQTTGASGNSGGFVTEGPWAMHRMFDRAVLTPGRVPEQMIATFDIGGSKVAFEVTASSVRSPFHLTQLESFSCPGRS